MLVWDDHVCELLLPYDASADASADACSDAGADASSFATNAVNARPKPGTARTERQAELRRLHRKLWPHGARSDSELMLES